MYNRIKRELLDLMPCDFAAVNLTLLACAMSPNQQNFTRHDERFNFSTVFSDCQIGQVHVTFKSYQAQWHSSWSSFLTESLIFLIFLLFLPNFRYFSQRFKSQSWYRFHLHDARLLAGVFHLVKNSENSGSGLNEKRFFGSPNWKILRKSGTAQKVVPLSRLERPDWFLVFQLHLPGNLYQFQAHGNRIF